MYGQLQKIDFHRLVEWFNQLLFWHRSRFMKNFRFDTIFNITQEPQEQLKFSFACGFIGKSAVKTCKY